MQITMRGVTALQHFRQQLQDDAGESFPHCVLTELLVLYDVCKCLEVNYFFTKDILGEIGLRHVTNYINTSTWISVDWERVSEVEIKPVAVQS